MDNTPRSPRASQSWSTSQSWSEALSPFASSESPTISLAHLNAHIDGAGPIPNYSLESAPIVDASQHPNLAPYTWGALPVQFVGFGEQPAPPRHLSKSPTHWTPPPFTGTTLDYYVPTWYDNARPWMPYRPVGDIDLSHEHWWHHESGRPLFFLPNERAILHDTEALVIVDDIVNLQAVGRAMASAFAGPRGEHMRHWESVRLAFYEWQGFIAWILAHLPETAMHPNVIHLEWCAVLDHWNLAWNDRIGMYLDLAQPINTLPDIRLLIAHNARPRYVWQDAFIFESRLAGLNPHVLRARDWIQATADKERQARKDDQKSRACDNKLGKMAGKKKKVMTDDDWEFQSNDSMSRLDMRTAEEKARDNHPNQPTSSSAPQRTTARDPFLPSESQKAPSVSRVTPPPSESRHTKAPLSPATSRSTACPAPTGAACTPPRRPHVVSPAPR
ncbi:hypothetical protein EWM64_g8835 [Hericium alpestre]|uniref:Uncharacterized protein n=1 Tax=Hericium alpestre TaxID=135208 RepID=A0A4Y9ZLK7_9AGAM|nr:hypothetical protein EWM64_g8835 [Hericium alpestre]